VTNDVQELHLRICRLEAELTRTAGHVDTLRRRWRRTLRGGFVVATLALASVTSFTLSAQEPTTYKDMTVTGTFRVVDKSGKIIMIVGEAVPGRGVSLRDEQGSIRISLTAISTPGISLDGNGGVGVSLGSGINNGVYITRHATKDPATEKLVPAHVEAALEANEIEGGKLWVANKEGHKIFHVADAVAPMDSRIAIGTSEGGAFGIRVYTKAADKLLASMGETKGGEGAVAAYDAAGLARAVMFGHDAQFSAMSTGGKPLATLSSKNNQGIVSINNNASGVAVASLFTEGGGGKLELANAAGNTVADGGVLPSGVGVLRAYPLGSPGAGLVGMPGTFLMGRTGEK
jgi:hypothetical protein